VPNDDFAARIAEAIELLESVRDDRGRLADLEPEVRQRLLIAAGRVARPGPVERRQLAVAARKRRDQARRDSDRQRLSLSGIREKRAEAVFTTPALVGRAPVAAGRDIDRVLTERASAAREPSRVVDKPRNCYVCKTDYHELHHFYDSLCPACAELNWHKRHQTADLSGRFAVITGARVKIGYQAAIMLLRAGCHVVVTTRFPRDAASRYAREADCSDWSDRLEIHGIDLRHTPSVETLARYLDATLPRLDFLLNNACQTVRRPPGYYAHLMPAERAPDGQLSEAARRLLRSFESRSGSAPATALAQSRSTLSGSAELSQLAMVGGDVVRDPQIFPAGQLDADLQQLDRRDKNSWRLGLHEVSAVELLEVHLINAVAPFVLNARLKPLMSKNPARDKHIVNVSAMEGQFYRALKTDKHPHTNMAKASLNMMTRTSAADYIKDGIHMNSVDTGWITDEDPSELAARKIVEQGFHPPLDIVDGAARICDPIFDGIRTGKHVFGRFLKDYAPTDW